MLASSWFWFFNNSFSVWNLSLINVFLVHLVYFTIIFFAAGIIIDLATKIIDKIGTRNFSITTKMKIIAIAKN